MTTLCFACLQEADVPRTADTHFAIRLVPPAEITHPRLMRSSTLPSILITSSLHFTILPICSYFTHTSSLQPHLQHTPSSTRHVKVSQYHSTSPHHTCTSQKTASQLLICMHAALSNYTQHTAYSRKMVPKAPSGTRQWGYVREWFACTWGEQVRERLLAPKCVVKAFSLRVC